MAETTRFLKIELIGITVDDQATAARKINAAFRRIDAHDHGINGGAPIRFSSINIDTADFQNKAIRNVSGVTFGTSATTQRLYIQNNDLYYNNGTNAIQITTSSGVNTVIPPNANLIFGDYATAGAQIKYNQAGSSYRMQRSATDNQNADVTARTFTIKEGAQGSTTLAAPTLADDQTITLPTLPTTTRPLNITQTGQINTTNIPINAWVSGTAYSTGDKVTFRGAIWQRTSDAQSSLTLSPLQDRARWIKSSGEQVRSVLSIGNTVLTSQFQNLTLNTDRSIDDYNQFTAVFIVAGATFFINFTINEFNATNETLTDEFLSTRILFRRNSSTSVSFRSFSTRPGISREASFQSFVGFR